MKKDLDIKRLFDEAEARNVRQAKISFKDHERIVKFVAEKEIKSPHQNIIIGRNESLGRLLVIDNEIQFTELDYSTYHELMVWPGMISVMDRKRRPKPNVAIYGGGDGLAAAEVLKFGVVPTIVDLDASVINVCRDHFSDLNQGSLNMSNVVIGDALKHVPEEKYDFIMIDLTAQSACPFLYDDDAIAKYKNDLAVDGVILFYAEYMMAGGFYDGLCRHFQCSFPYGAFTQFVDSYFTFCLFSNWNIDVPKIKRTRREGRYFCRKHVHQLDFDFMPRMPFEETFEVAKVAEVVLKD